LLGRGAVPALVGNTWREAILSGACRRSHPAPGRALSKQGGSIGCLRLAFCEGAGLLPGRREINSTAHPVAGSNPLRPQQGVEPMVVETSVGHFGKCWLRMIGDAQPRLLDHQPIIGAV